jgi:hypothetical protein
MGHDLTDQRLLEMHRLIGEKLRKNPKLLETSISRLREVIVERRQKDLYVEPFEEWLNILETWPKSKIFELLISKSEEGNRLRQSGPFFGVLSEEERQKVFRLIHRS